MQYLVEVAACGAPGRSQANQKSGEQCDGKSKGEDTPIKAEIEADWNGSYFNVNRADEPAGPYARQQSQNSAGRAQQQTFGEQLTHNAHALRAQSGADGQFALASGGAYQNDVGHIKAGQQQHQAGQAHEDGGHYNGAIAGIRVRPRGLLRVEVIAHALVRL